MRNTKSIVIFSTIAVILFIAGYILYHDDLNANGKAYPSKEKLCTHFAQSYLRSVQKTDNAISTENISGLENQKWEMAIDIETDFYNLCMLNLTKESLKTYKSKVIEKYQK